MKVNHQIKLTVVWIVANSKQDLLEKCNALGSGHTFSFQIENGNTNLICSTLPIRELLNACQREDLVNMRSKTFARSLQFNGYL